MSESMYMSSKISAEYISVTSFENKYRTKCLQPLKSRSFIMKMRGRIVDRCYLPLLITLKSLNTPLMNTVCCRFKKKLRNQLKITPFTA